jgi:serine/threonine protein kinase
MKCSQPLSNDHPSDHQLIRHLERPTQEDIDQVNQHIKECWECEARLAALAGSPRPECLPDRVLAPGLPVQQPPTLTVGAGELVGHYQLLAPIARGGMAEVWRCYDEVLQRELAMKFLKEKYLTHADFSAFCRRFEREARVLGELQHPSIVPIYDSGTLPDRRPFFVMKLVKGHTLAQLLEEHGPGARWLGVFAAVCQAVAYAHSVGVIHRDLKPSNVMVGAFGEVQVMDLGLAKVLPWSGILRSGPRAVWPTSFEEPENATETYVIPDECDDHTRPNSVMGTLEFMPPEQAQGLACEADERSDVFGLGAFLCAILTGKPPYVSDSKEVVERLARNADLTGAHARLETCGADANLIKLAKHCLAKEPDQRPQNAGEVATAVRTYLAEVEQRMHQAERDRAAAEARGKEARRRMRWVAASAGLFLSLLLVTALFAWRESEMHQKLLAATINRALTAAMIGDLGTAEKETADAEQAGASAGEVHMLRGQIALHRGESRKAREHLEEAVRLLPKKVAAWGMLAAAHADDGHWERYDTAMRKMEQLTPSTPEDFLFKGYAEAQLEPERGLRTIQQAFDRRPAMGVAFLLRAEVRAFVAQDTDDLEAAEGAVQDARYAKELLPNNPAAIWVSLEAHLAKAGVHEHRNQPEQRRAERELAGKDADALKPFTALPEAVVFRWIYFREVGEEEKVLDELREASKNTEHMYVTSCCALALYRRGDLQEAFDVLDRRRGTYTDRLLPFVLAELDYPDKHNWPARALKTYEEYANRTQDGAAVMDAQSALRLLGMKDEAVKAGKALLEQKDRFYTLRREPIVRCARYNAGKLKADELLQLAGRSQWDRCLAHYSVAMTKLAEGDRDGARKHFDEAVKTGASGWGEYDLSWVFRDRLDKDPNWPPRIAKKP